MKTLKYILTFSLIFILFSGCSDNGNGSGLSDEEILDLAWENFGLGNYQEAIDGFFELIDKEVYIAEAYSGLGWSYSRFGQLLNSAANFGNGFLNEPTADILDDLYAGLSFVKEALEEYSDALTNSAEVNNGWQFDHDTELSFDDLVLLRAICYYALADFANSLLEVQILVPDFVCDVETEEGRAALAAKIEELRGTV